MFSLRTWGSRSAVVWDLLFLPSLPFAKAQGKADYRNGVKHKKLRSSYGETPIDVPQDRDGDFEPQIVQKRKKDISAIEQKIISMYAKGMTTSDIEAHIRDIYGLECSDTTISRITDKILPVVREWQSRPLEEIYSEP